MDQIEFERFVAQFAREYYASPRSTKVPTPAGPVNLSRGLRPTDAKMIWVLEDFADFLKTADPRGDRS